MSAKFYKVKFCIDLAKYMYVMLSLAAGAVRRHFKANKMPPNSMKTDSLLRH